MSKKYEMEVSRYLSYVLRHAPETIGLKIDAHGWADLDELVARSMPPLTREQIEAAVRHNEKQRFMIEGNSIRANQGHSIPVEVAMIQAVPPDLLYHGTAARHVEIIKEEGIKTMGRNYVHLSKDVKTATEVGSRHGTPAVLTIEAGLMRDAGHKFWLSSNGVYLADFIPPLFIQ